ncbi:hypothetical protein FIBSPDRAFT_390970 [Athelia psychrophila]|uniref:Uncharacterized protein n=1 Tax=Athelia psychrophila TaxID=1759441 RepID=A0A166NWB9_9AGAM|nr:hypothetical protein FIBSPDRAFT_390970 [Fibularhizoctonia sp. CBS 109695]
MSVAVHHDKWWPTSNKQSSHNHISRSGQDLSHSFASHKPYPVSRKPSVMKFSAITSAMGFTKSKKHSIPIQQPPAGLTVDTSSQTIRQGNRPPAKSVSTVQSWDDEPETPSDFGDHSRFRPRTPNLANVSSPVLHGRSALPDPSRLSAYSGSYMSDPGGKGGLRPFMRASYASSSQSSAYSASSSAPSLTYASRPSSTQRHPPSSLKPPTPEFEDDGEIYMVMPPNQGGSSSTLTERNTGSADGQPARVGSTQRSRGSVDDTAGWNSQSSSDFLRTVPPPPRVTSLPVPTSAPSGRARVLVRQASSSRIGPPKAPPKAPPPPVPAIMTAHHGAGDVSSMFFAPLHTSVPRDASGLDEEVYTPDFRPTRNRTVKKSVSHQSFRQQSPSAIHIHIPKSKPTPLPEDTIERAPRRQRSFHSTPHPKPPTERLPAIPILSPTSPSTTTPDPHTPPPHNGGRRGSITGSFARKRLFSNASSKQPPSLQGPAIDDDDLQSLDIESALNIAMPLSSASSAVFGSPPDDTPSSPMSSGRQQILSPAEIRQLEASFTGGEAVGIFDLIGNKRPRVHSFASTSTSISDLYDSPVPPHHYILDRRNQRPASRDSNMTQSPKVTSRPRRPSTAQPTMDKYVYDAPSPASARLSLYTALPGLPLPPRPRRQMMAAPPTEDLSFTPLSPPPLRRHATSTAVAPRAQRTTASTEDLPFAPLQPPPIRRYATSTAVPRSIMKKSSFLDIFDDPPPSSYQPLTPPSIPFAGDNFLEMEKGKDSFDTIR